MNEISFFLFAPRVFIVVITVSTNLICESDNICVVLVNFF